MQKTKNKKYIDLGKDPVGPLLLRMSIPSITAMLVMALYNIVDTFWIAKISPQAIAALTICFPIQMIFGGLGAGTGVGVGSLASRMFGTGDDIKAHRAAGQVIFLAVFFGLSVIVSVLIFHVPILIFFGASKEILSLSKEYLIVIIFGTPFLFFMMMADNLFRAEGKPNIPMYVIASSAIINAILDPFLIFGWGPFPEMGIRGAAIATVIAQIAAFAPSVYFLLFHDSKYLLKWNYIFPNFSILMSIYRVGFPSLLIHITMSLALTAYNHILGGFGPLAVATFGLAFRINGMLIMILFGIGQGVMPMVGYNYGAGNYTRLKKIVITAIKASAIVGGITCIFTEFFARHIIMAFTSNQELLAIAVPALRIYVSTQMMVGPIIVCVNMFNGVGKGLMSMSLLMSRQIFFLIPSLYFLSSLIGLNGVWMAQPLSNVLGLLMTFVFTKGEFNLLKSNIR